MKKVRLIFVGLMLTVLCIGFTSCSDMSEDVNPTLIESVDADSLDINVKSEDPEENGDPSSGPGSSGTGGQ